MVKIIITDAVLQVIKIESNGTITDDLVWQTPQGFPAISSKGSIMASSGNEFDLLPVGSNGQVLVADSTTTTGVRWATGGGGSLAVGAPVVGGTDGGVFFQDGGVFSQDPTFFQYDSVNHLLLLGDGSPSPLGPLSIDRQWDSSIGSMLTIFNRNPGQTGLADIAFLTGNLLQGYIGGADALTTAIPNFYRGSLFVLYDQKLVVGSATTRAATFSDAGIDLAKTLGRARIADGAVAAGRLVKLTNGSGLGKVKEYTLADTIPTQITGISVTGGADGATISVVEIPNQPVAVRCDGSGTYVAGGTAYLSQTLAASVTAVDTGVKVGIFEISSSPASGDLVQVNFSGAEIVANKNITVSLSQPFGSVTLTNPTIYQAVYKIPADVKTVYVSLGDRNLLSPNGNAADLTGIKIAGGQPDATQQTFVGSPTVYTGQTIPPYMFTNKLAMPVQTDSNGFMMFRWSFAAGTHFCEFQAGTGQNGYCKLLDNSTDIVATSGFVATFSPAGQFCVQYETQAPRLVIWSDSIQRGIANGTECGLNSSLVGLQVDRGYAVSAIGVASTLMSVWAGLTNWLINDTSSCVGANVMIALGTNDINASVSSTSLIQYAKQLCQQAKAAGAKKVIMCTIPPSSAFTTPKNTELSLFNNWVRTNPGGWFDVVFDVWNIVKDPGTPTQLLPAYAATGGIHFTAAAFTALRAAFPVIT